MFTKRDIKNLSQFAAFEGLSGKSLLYPLLSNRERQEIIRTSSDEESRRIAAVIQIQRVWRGCKTRNLLFSILRPHSSIGGSSSNASSRTLSSCSALSRMASSRNPSFFSTGVRSAVSRDLSRIQSSYHKYTVDTISTLSKETLLTFQEFCAYSIQTWWRGVMARCRKLPSVRIMKSFTTLDATLTIQRAWRRHVDLQVFNYYKDLVRFRCQGDAKFMLKCINPKECDLLDTASGVHVRFRLGGMKFPPTIYYKIFSHINVADMCSFSPRDYTRHKKIPSKFTQHRGVKEYIGTKENTTEGWYQRIENNGWRPIADRVLKGLQQDSISLESSSKKIDYKHDKLQRRQDVEKNKKRKKIQWLQKMYQAGVLETKDERENEVKELVDTAALSVFNSVEQHGIEAVDDWEVEELLEWTNTLNFDSYLQDWYKYGTTEIKKQDIEELKLSY